MQKPLLWGMCPAASACFSRMILQTCAKLEVCVCADGCSVHKKVMERCVSMMLHNICALKLPSVACR